MCLLEYAQQRDLWQRTKSAFVCFREAATCFAFQFMRHAASTLISTKGSLSPFARKCNQFIILKCLCIHRASHFAEAPGASYRWLKIQWSSRDEMQTS